MNVEKRRKSRNRLQRDEVLRDMGVRNGFEPICDDFGVVALEAEMHPRASTTKIVGSHEGSATHRVQTFGTL